MEGLQGAEIEQLSQLIGWYAGVDNFQTMTTFLRQRGLLRAAQVIMAMIAAWSALVPLLTVASGPRPSVDVLIVSWVGSVFALCAAGFWLLRWPSQLLSKAAASVGAVLIACWSVTQVPTAPAIALLTCSALAVTGAYFAVFHSLRGVVVNGLICVVTTVYVVWHLAGLYGSAQAVAALWLVLFVNVSIPVLVAALAHALRQYVVRAGTDELTGLLNRRGFVEEVERILDETSQVPHTPQTPARLVILMIDIDNFKRINDSFGHAEGDRVILAVAHLLRRQAPLPAVVCRAGGEEFLVGVVTRSDAMPFAQRVREAVADLPDGITISVGMAIADNAERQTRDPKSVVAQLVADADAAMYLVKRGGGNDVLLQPDWIQPRNDSL